MLGRPCRNSQVGFQERAYLIFFGQAAQRSLVLLFECGHQHSARLQMLHRKQSLDRLPQLEGLPRSAENLRGLVLAVLDLGVDGLEQFDVVSDFSSDLRPTQASRGLSESAGRRRLFQSCAAPKIIQPTPRYMRSWLY